MNSEFGIRNPESKGFGQFNRDGFLLHKSLVEPNECNLLAAELTSLFEQQQKSAKSKIGGVRNLLRTSSRVSRLSKAPQVLSILEESCGLKMFPVRAILFDKNPASNWLVPWHQDLAIALAAKHETPGFTGWSIKDGVFHVHPPQEILANMVAVRLHLDDCSATNGALKVISGSHHCGKLKAADILKWTNNYQAVVCEASKGDALLMRPLLLHASSAAENPQHRRVLHIEFAAQGLPHGLRWLDC